MAENKQTEDGKQATRKTAPAITVSETLSKKNPIDQLIADNPGESFVYVPGGSSDEALAKRGLELVTSGGAPVKSKARLVARCVDDSHERKVTAAHDEATEMISGVDGLEATSKTSVKKAPKKKLPKKK